MKTISGFIGLLESIKIKAQRWVVLCKMLECHKAEMRMEFHPDPEGMGYSGKWVLYVNSVTYPEQRLEGASLAEILDRCWNWEAGQNNWSI